MIISKLVENISTRSFNQWAKDPASSLLNLGAIGLALGCAAQLFMLVKNKDIDKEKKKFLVPQELADGVINVGLTYTISKFIKDAAVNSLEKGRFTSPKTFDFIDNFNTQLNTFQQYIEVISRRSIKDGIICNQYKNKHTSGCLEAIINMLNGVNYKKIEKGEPYEGLIKDSFKFFKTKADNEELIKTIKSVQDDFGKFKNSVGIIAAIGGSVLASSIIVPFVRNKVASKFQQKALAKENKLKSQMQYMPVKSLPITSPFSKFNDFKISKI